MVIKTTLLPEQVEFEENMFVLYERPIPAMPLKVVLPSLPQAMLLFNHTAVMMGAIVYSTLDADTSAFIWDDVKVVIESQGRVYASSIANEIRRSIVMQGWKQGSIMIATDWSGLRVPNATNDMTMEISLRVPSFTPKYVSQRGSILYGRNPMGTMVNPSAWFAPYAPTRHMYRNETLVLVAFSRWPSTMSHNSKFLYRWYVVPENTNSIASSYLSLLLERNTTAREHSGVLRLPLFNMVEGEQYRVFVSVAESRTGQVLVNSSSTLSLPSRHPK